MPDTTQGARATASTLLQRKPITALSAGQEGHALRRSLGATSLVALGIGAIIGAGLFAVTGIAAAENAGPAVVLSFLLAALGCGFAGLCYSELASMIPVSGSAYTYAYATLGELVAWIIGWDLVLEYAVGAAAVSVSWSSYVGSLLRQWGFDLPPRLLASPFTEVRLPDGTLAHGLVNLPAILIITTISLLLIKGIRESAGVNAVIVALKVAVVIAVIAVGAFFVQTANYHPFIPPNTGQFGAFGLSGILRGAGVIFFAYIGFDAVSTAAQETRNPGRDLPIGILGSLAICTVLYVAFALVLTGIVNYHAMLGDAAPVATAIDRTPFPALKVAVKLGIILGFTSVILVLLLGQSRVFYAMARDGLLPRLFAEVHPRWHTPYLSSLLFMVFTGLLAGFLPISELGHMTSIGTLLAFAIVCAGVLVLRRTDPDRERAFRVPWCPAVPVLGILTCLMMMASLDRLTWLRLIVWLAIGLIVYFAYGRRHSVLSRQG
ncbi:MAG TPA: amino acid permease [Acetobacteraceae bacterium]|nr:amino acid permease [Acetobacteraceae bacterium]